MRYNPTAVADRITPYPSFESPLHGRTGAKHAPTQWYFSFGYVALAHRLWFQPVALRFAAIVIGRDETSGKPRGEAQGCTTISVGRKAACGVPGCPRPHTLATPRYSALYRHDSRTIKCPPLRVAMPCTYRICPPANAHRFGIAPSPPKTTVFRGTPLWRAFWRAGKPLPQSAFADGNSGCGFHTGVSGM